MTTTYSFTRQQLHQHRVQEQEAVVYSIDWTLTATDGEYSAGLPGSTAVPFDRDAEFVPIDQLTDGKITEWIVDNTAADTLEIYHKNLDAQLKLLKDAE
jgi:hypothetical protein